MSIVESMDEREVAKRMEEEERRSRIKDNENAYARQVGCDLHPAAGGEIVSMTRFAAMRFAEARSAVSEALRSNQHLSSVNSGLSRLKNQVKNQVEERSEQVKESLVTLSGALPGLVAGKSDGILIERERAPYVFVPLQLLDAGTRTQGHVDNSTQTQGHAENSPVPEPGSQVPASQPAIYSAQSLPPPLPSNPMPSAISGAAGGARLPPGVVVKGQCKLCQQQVGQQVLSSDARIQPTPGEYLHTACHMQKQQAAAPQQAAAYVPPKPQPAQQLLQHGQSVHDLRAQAPLATPQAPNPQAQYAQVYHHQRPTPYMHHPQPPPPHHQIYHAHTALPQRAHVLAPAAPAYHPQVHPQLPNQHAQVFASHAPPPQLFQKDSGDIKQHTIMAVNYNAYEQHRHSWQPQGMRHGGI